MGIYITQQKKEELEARISDLDLFIQDNKDKGYYSLECFHGGRKMIYNEILSEAIVLPVEESWEDVELYPPDNESQFKKTMSLKNGVIIKSKES